MSGTTSATSSPQPELAFLTLPFPRQSPSPNPGDVNDYPDAVIVLDNLKAHHNKTAKRMVEEAGFSVVYLPPYSPEWSPMEECWSKIKTVLRTVGARTKAALAHAVPAAWEGITPEDALGWFEHCGYRAANPRM